MTLIVHWNRSCKSSSLTNSGPFPGFHDHGIEKDRLCARRSAFRNVCLRRAHCNEKELHAGSSGCSSFFSCDRSLFLIFFPERFLFSEIIRIPRSGYQVQFVLA